MCALLIIALLGAPADVQVCFAPDQPIPHVYVDDALALELTASADVNARVQVEIEDHAGETRPALDTAVTLRAQGVRWLPLEGVALERGRYVARVRVEAGGEEHVSTHAFCRIDRPLPEVAPPVGARLSETDPAALQALRDLPLRQVRLDAAHPEMPEALDRAVQSKFRLSIGLALDPLENAAAVAKSIAERLGEPGPLWAVEPGSKASELDALTGDLRRGGSPVRLVLAARDAESLAAALASPAAAQASAVALAQSITAPADIAAFRLAAEQAGYEGMPVHLLDWGPAAETPADPGAKLIHGLLEGYATGAVYAEVDAATLYQAGGFTSAYVYLSAFAHRMNGSKYVGNLDAGKNGIAQVYRNGGDWLLVAWAPGEPTELVVSPADAERLRLTDAFNNPMPDPERVEGALTLMLTADPWYLSGTGGPVVAAAALATAGREARAFLAYKPFAELLPQEVQDILKALADPEAAGLDRPQLLALFPMFPLIEEQWHTGALPRDTAVPAMASLVRLVRALGQLEQETGEPFIGPLQDTLDRCAEYQSHYLVNSGGRPKAQARGDWLLAEVSRLVAEARALADEGRVNEAHVIATLAEWRARSLQHALHSAPREETRPENGAESAGSGE